MVPDAEALKVMCDCLVKLDIGDFRVKVNHRGILDGMFEVCGVPADKVRPISSAVDKLDKMAWEDVRKEMVEDKGLDPVVADSIKQYVELKSGSDLDAFITRLEALPEFVANARVKAGLEEMRLLATYLEALGVAQLICRSRGGWITTLVSFTRLLSRVQMLEESGVSQAEEDMITLLACLVEVSN
jgi:histidyl-tRNA synthetase